jgi:hypothetical protein
LLITHGLAALATAESLSGSEFSGPYVIQAALAACHARALAAADTDWIRIATLYSVLASLAPSPVIELNRAVAVSMADGPAAGLAIVDTLAGEPALRGFANNAAACGLPLWGFRVAIGRRRLDMSLFGGSCAMVDVLGLHGIAQQQRGRLQMLPDWQAALSDGVERAKGLASAKPSLELAYYGDVFLADTDSKGAPQDPEALDADVVAFLEQVQNEIVDSSQPLDVEDPAKGLKKGLPKPVTGLAAWLERRFGLAGKVLFFGDVVQVRRFQRYDDLAETVLGRVREMLPQSPRVLVGHSLGSIVAYEALCRIPGHGITTLITLGSPLGLGSIREGMSQPASDRIPNLPPGVLRWVNIYDPRDAVSFAGGLAAYWPKVEDKTVDNEKEPHSIIRYLSKKVTGQVVVGALT